MRQTLALFIDAYRELNARKLFWITMGLSVLVVAVFGMVGLSPKGLKVLWWEFPAPFNSTVFSNEAFVRLMFANLGVKFWLGWLSTILALVSTAGIIPDFLAGGAIELTLSKPIGRLRLFLTKYATGLLFVALQVGAFSLASMLVIWIKAGAFEPRVLLAIPIVVAFYSYLFCVCALLGLITRSTVASLLITMLFWFVIWGLHATEQGFLTFRVSSTLQVERAEKAIKTIEDKIASLEAAPAPDAPGADAADHAPPPRPITGGLGAALKWALLNPPKADGTQRTTREIRLEEARKQLEREQGRLTSAQADKDWLSRVHRPILLAKSFLPKTTETTDLLARALLSESETDQLRAQGEDNNEVDFGDHGVGISAREFTKAMENERRSRSVWWILGTSLAFEAVVLGLCCWIFVRRDF